MGALITLLLGVVLLLFWLDGIIEDEERARALEMYDRILDEISKR